jgi:hypothetical protein
MYVYCIYTHIDIYLWIYKCTYVLRNGVTKIRSFFVIHIGNRSSTIARSTNVPICVHIGHIVSDREAHRCAGRVGGQNKAIMPLRFAPGPRQFRFKMGKGGGEETNEVVQGHRRMVRKVRRRAQVQDYVSYVDENTGMVWAEMLLRRS